MPFETVMPFGRWKGLRLIEVPAEYCSWLLDEWPGRNALSKTLREKLAERVKIKEMESAR